MVLGRTVRKFRSVETSLTALLDDLGIVSAHFAGRGSADLKSFASIHPERIASLTLLCPAVLDTATLAPLAERLLVVTGDHGPGPRRVQAGLPDLPQATVVMLNDYPGHTWADIAAERGDSIGAAMQQFLRRHDIHYRSAQPAGAGRRDCRHFLSRARDGTATGAVAARSVARPMGAADPGAVHALLHDHPWRSAARQRRQSRGARAVSGYIGVVRTLLDTLAIVPGESVLEVGCGSGVIMRELARRTAGANRLIGRDMSPFLLREARALARREGLLDHIDFGEGRAEALPLARWGGRCRFVLNGVRGGRRRSDAVGDLCG